MSACDDDESFLTAESGSDVSFCSINSASDDHTLSLGELLINTFSQSSKTFNVCHINAQSIPSHISDLLETFRSEHIHAILVSETFLKPSLPSPFFPIPGFVLIRNDRVGKGGGGVAIYLKKCFSYKLIQQSLSAYSASPEYLFIEVDIGIKFLLGVIYCPPNITNSLNNLLKLELVLETLASDFLHTIIMGDLNTCLKYNPKAKTLISLIDSVNLNIINSEPTHHSANNDTVLDLIIVSDSNLVNNYGQFPAPAFSHHDLIYLSFKMKVPKPKPITLNQRNFSRMDICRLDDDASSMGWNEIDSVSSVDGMVDFLCSNIISLFNRHAPIHPVRLKRSSSPWLTDAICKAMAKRDRDFRRYKRDRCDDNWAIYKKSRNRCNLLVRNAKKQHITEQIQLASPAGLWKFLSSLGIGKFKSHESSLCFDLNTLNDHFSASDKIVSWAKSAALSEIEKVSPPEVVFSFAAVSQDRILKTILSLKSKAVGSDDIGRIMILPILKHILPTITHIINYSFSECLFPKQWREAYVIPLPKLTNPSLLKHYRPISILPFFSKIIESVAHAQLTEFLTDNMLFNPFQSGFRKGHSTTTALLNVTEDLRLNMENAHLTVLVLIDFSNAFNAVDHDLLLAMLPKLGLSESAVNWFCSYLRGRRQKTRHCEDFSDWAVIEAGVPQGGILSPLLFSLFINFLCPHLLCQYHMYADDLQMYCSAPFEDIHLAILALNNDLTRLLSWSTMFGITVNPDKCQAIIIGGSRQLAKIDSYDALPQLSYNGHIIPFSPTVKNLGLTLDSKLSWIPYIKELSRKFHATLHSIIRLKKFLPISTKITLVNSLLIPILDYADVAFIDLNQDLLNKLDRLMNAGIRFIFCLRKYDHISLYRAKLKWLPIRERRNLRALCLLFSVLKDPTTPEYLKNRFNFFADVHDRSLRSSNNLLLEIPAHSSSYRDKSFSIQAARLWNDLPDDVRKIDSRERFKRRTRELFLESSPSSSC